MASHDERIEKLRHDLRHLEGVSAFAHPVADVESDLEHLLLSADQARETAAALLGVAHHLLANASRDAPPVVASALRSYIGLASECGLPNLRPFLEPGLDWTVQQTALQCVGNVLEQYAPREPSLLAPLADGARELAARLLSVRRALASEQESLCASAFVAHALLAENVDAQLVARLIEAVARGEVAALSLFADPLEEAAANWRAKLPERAAALEGVARRLSAQA